MAATESRGLSNPVEILHAGWDLIRPHRLILVLASVAAGVVMAIVRAVFPAGAAVLLLFVQRFLSCGLQWYLMRAYMGLPVSWDMMMLPATSRPVAIVALVLSRSVMPVVCLLFGMFLGIKSLLLLGPLCFAAFLLFFWLDAPILLALDVGPFAAMALSARTVRRHLALFCTVGLAICGINLLGLLALGLGLLLSYPLTTGVSVVLSMRALEQERLLVNGRATGAHAAGPSGAPKVAALLVGLVVLAAALATPTLLPLILPRQATESMLPVPAGFEGEWVADGRGHAVRVLESRVGGEPGHRTLSVLWQVHNAAAEPLQLKKLHVGVAHATQMLFRGLAPSTPPPGSVAPQTTSPVLVTDAPVDDVVGLQDLTWGLCSGECKALERSVQLTPAAVPLADLQAPNAEDFALPALPWQPAAVGVNETPTLSWLMPASRGCDWVRQRPGKPSQVLAHVQDCAASIALSGDGDTALIVDTIAGRMAVHFLMDASQAPVVLPLPKGAYAAAFDARGRPIALAHDGNNPWRTQVFDGNKWGEETVFQTVPPAAPDHAFWRRASPALRALNCRMLHTPDLNGQLRPLSLDECTTPDLDPPSAADQVTLTTSLGTVMGSASRRPRRGPAQLMGPVKLLVHAPNAPPLADGRLSQETTVVTRGPFVFLHGSEPQPGPFSLVVDLRNGRVVAQPPREAVAVAFWPYVGGPAGTVTVPEPPEPQPAPAPVKSKPNRRSGGHKGRRR